MSLAIAFTPDAGEDVQMKEPHKDAQVYRFVLVNY